MKNIFTLNTRSALIISIAAFLTACDNSSVSHTISYTNDIQPIFDKHCLECHQTGGAGTLASELKLNNYEAVMKGTKFGPIIKAGDSISSTLVILVEGRADASINMPHGKRPPISKQHAQQLRQWINEGALNN